MVLQASRTSSSGASSASSSAALPVLFPADDAACGAAAATAPPPPPPLLSARELARLLRVKTPPSAKRLEAYRRAFVHASCGAAESNERLEFLGDAVLDLVVAEYLFERYPCEDEGFLTQMRSSLVNGKMLARLGRLLGLEQLVVLSRAAEPSRHSDGIVEDAFEAFVGAMFLDRGIKGAKEWFVALIEENLDFAQLMAHNEKDMLTRLYRERFGRDIAFVASKSARNQYHVRMFERDSDERRGFIAEGFGATRRDAITDAARRGLQGHGISV